MQLNHSKPASFPSHAQQPGAARRSHSKARSISSLPSSARGSPLLPSSPLSGPGRLYPASPARRRSPTVHSQPGLPSMPSMPAVLHMSSSPRHSPRQKTNTTTRAEPPTTMTQTPTVLSPSNLPATDCMSYFPPFESMGSGDPEEGSSAAGPSRPASRLEDQARSRSRGSTPDSKRTSSNQGSQRHAKVRSLGSLGGLISAWTSFTPSPATTPMEQPGAHANAEQDGKAVDALTRRTSQAKRRTLEPMQSETFVEWERNVKRSQARRQTVGEGEDIGQDSSESLAQRQRPHLSLPALPSWRNPMPSPPVVTLSPDIPAELFHVEISNPASSSSSPFKNATLPPSHLSFLRRLTTGGSYPASLADMDRDDADAASPTIEQVSRMCDADDAQADVEAVDAGLSPTSAYASLSSYSESRPVTPADEREADEAGNESEELDDHLERFGRFERISNANYYTTSVTILRKSYISLADGEADPYYLDPARYSLERTVSASSGRSCDSKETIRPSAVVGRGIGIGLLADEKPSKDMGNAAEGEVTPKAGKRPTFEIGSD